MYFKTFIIYLGFFNFLSSEGSRIIYPDEVPALIETLGVGSGGIRTRFSFPDKQGRCSTDDGKSGECLSISECPELQEYLRVNNGIRNNENIKFLRSRICRFLRNSVHLCCVTNTSTPVTPRSTRITAIGSNNPKVELPTRDECGFSTARRITDGKEITHGSHPWLVALGFPREKDSFRSLCGGTLITKKHVLTAAHCFIKHPGVRSITHARLGEHSLSNNTEREPPVTLKIVDTKSPGYNRVSHINDLELLVLEKDVEFTNFIRPACLPVGLKNVDFQKIQMVIVGWGDTFFRSFDGTDTPLAANISAVSKAECKEAYVLEPQVPLDNTQFCAGQGPKDACQGDSGGPLLYSDLKEHFRYFLVGVISFGVGCANPSFPGVYTFIPEFLDWITENL